MSKSKMSQEALLKEQQRLHALIEKRSGDALEAVEELLKRPWSQEQRNAQFERDRGSQKIGRSDRRSKTESENKL
jgi:hypothetical protein